ncbi:MAG: hypothetical protein EAZ91_07965 [Cytophagales bacterium]|nr:MAG: hypothetical protein EAZ91_07965 [Cytophagales bacterium]
MEQEEKGVSHEDAQINGRTQGAQGTDNMDADRAIQDNKRTDLVDESANGLDSVEVRGGQDGRNNRGIGGMDMDAKNGVLRMGDQDDTTMQVTEAGADSAVASTAQTNTATADVTTAGPDDYASAETVGVPNAQKEAKQDAESTDANDSDTNAAVSQEEKQEDVAETGTSIDHQPAY